MQPIKEYGSKAYFKRKYDIEGNNPRLAKELGNIHPGDGAKFHGRGFVQITGRTNYTVWKRRLKKNLVNNPDLALKPELAIEIIFGGMLNGTFTGKKLSDYFNEDKEDWRNARRIVNRLDKADLISGYAKLYYSSISYLN